MEINSVIYEKLNIMKLWICWRSTGRREQHKKDAKSPV